MNNSLIQKVMDIGRMTVSDCSTATLDGISLRGLACMLGSVIRCHDAGRISEEEALLFARAHWALAALQALHSIGTRP